MTLAAGARLGPYEIVSRLGAGGMGEVYRARDTRLGREVAVKVIPEAVAASPEVLRRFEREARAASALNHPNVVALYDVGRDGDVSWIAMELVDGTSLRDALDGAMPARRLLPIAAQIADGLAAAHEKGIVHRDLKPENVMVDRQGRVRILDFGLAKDAAPVEASGVSSPTVSLADTTREGTVLGTAGYMSPEQASGRALDFRTDQFSLGAILYEMATGVRAFQGGSPLETLASVIRDEPPPARERVPDLPPPLAWAIERCLAKDPGGRYGSTRDLARDLAALRDHVAHGGSSAALAGAAGASGRPSRAIPAAVWAALGAAALGSAALLLRPRPKRPDVRFSQMTFRSGVIHTARFAPDGETIVYGAAWNEAPFEIFSGRAGSVDSRSLSLPGADLLAVSPKGEMAVSLGRRRVGGFLFTGTLARAELSGGAPREVLDDVEYADWSPSGELAVVRPDGVRQRLELPAGHPLVETDGWISHPRISPRGDLVAYADHPISGDDSGQIAVVDRTGRKRVLSSGWASAQGVAWSRDGREVWFSASPNGFNDGIYAVTLAGKVRQVDQGPGRMILQDVSASGRVLLSQETTLGSFLCFDRTGTTRDLTWLDASIPREFSRDGSFIVFTEAGEGGGTRLSVYLRRLADAQAVGLGEGWAQGISPDMHSVLSIVAGPPAKLRNLPVGAGEPRDVAVPGLQDFVWAEWMPDGRRIAVAAHEPGQPNRLYLVPAEGGSFRAVSNDAVSVKSIADMGIALSRDGERIAVTGRSGRIIVVPVAGGPVRDLAGARPGEVPVGWDGGAVLVADPLRQPLEIDRLDPASGSRGVWRTIAPPHAGGYAVDAFVVVDPQGGAVAYNTFRVLSSLFVVDGLK